MTESIAPLAYLAAPPTTSLARVESRGTPESGVGLPDTQQTDEKRPDLQNDQETQGLPNALTDLGRRRLSILQDLETQHIVYRRIDSRTNIVEQQFPSEQELARVAFLRETAGHVLDATV